MRISLVLFILAPFIVFGQPPPGYYDPAAGLTGNQLRFALRDIITGHTVLDYTTLWSYFALTDHRDGSTTLVWDMYSDNPSGAPPYQYIFGNDQCGNYSGEGDCFNREHSFPKSWFGGDVPPMYSDLHHMYPTDGFVNNKRGELPYGKVGSADWTSQNGSRTGMNISAGYSGTVFEPIDAYKGDFARAYFYMLTRYWGQTTSWSSPMLQNGDLALWGQNLLLTWNNDDPVSTKEFDRNNVVFTHQNNRNPFIDNPQWASSIWGPVAGIDENNADGPGINAAEGILTIQLNGAPSNSSVEVFDIAGRSVIRTTLTDARTDLVLDQKPGVYIALIHYNGTRTAKPFKL